MRPLRHVTPACRVYCGADSLQQLASELDRSDASRAVVFCGQTIARHPDGLRLVAEALGDRYAGVFDGVTAHSPVGSVLEGAERLRTLAADAAIALGGGSAIVTARAASILLAEGRDINELCTQFPDGKRPVSPRLDKPKLPQFVVATTPTTAYAKAGSAVLDTARGQRLALFDPKTRAAALFIHPTLALTAPPALATSAAVNAFCIAVQGIESRSRDPLADALLIHALRLLASNLRRLAYEPDDAEVRGELMLGALLAGQGTDFAPTGLTSALSHAIGARFHLDNGITNAVLLPHAMRFNAPVTHERLALVADALGAHKPGSPVSVAVDAVEHLFAELALPRRLRETGVKEESLAVIVDDVSGDWFLHQNPRPVTGTAELLEVLRAAW
jgi:alcohol dehydrogenase class IV